MNAHIFVPYKSKYVEYDIDIICISVICISIICTISITCISITHFYHLF